MERKFLTDDLRKLQVGQSITLSLRIYKETSIRVTCAILNRETPSSKLRAKLNVRMGIVTVTRDAG